MSMAIDIGIPTGRHMAILQSPSRLLLTAVMAGVVAGSSLIGPARASAATPESALAPLEIKNRKDLKIVVQINSPSTIPNGVGKQILAVKNLYDQYTAIGLKPGRDFDLVVVFRGGGAQFLLNDAAYDINIKEPHPAGNPNKIIIENLNAHGVKFYECGAAMKMMGYSPEDIFAFSRIVVTGIGAIIDFEKAGYLPITP